MQCGVDIPLDEIVAEVKKKLAGLYVETNNGTANNLTIRGGLTVDNEVKADLCEILTDCIISKIQQYAPKDYITDIDFEGSNLVLTYKDGSTSLITRDIVRNWLQAGVEGGNLRVVRRQRSRSSDPNYTTETVGGVVRVVNHVQAHDTELREMYIDLRNKGETTTIPIDVSGLDDVYLNAGSINIRDLGTTTIPELILQRNDGNNLIAPLYGLVNWLEDNLVPKKTTDTRLVRGEFEVSHGYGYSEKDVYELVDGRFVRSHSVPVTPPYTSNWAESSYTLKLHQSDGTRIDIDLAGMDDIYIESAKLLTETIGNEQLFTAQFVRTHRNMREAAALSGTNAPTKYTMNISFAPLQNWVLDKLKDFTPTSGTGTARSRITSGNIATNAGYTLNLVRDDASSVPVNLQPLYDALYNNLKRDVVAGGYRLNTVDTDYSLQGDDFNGFTIVRANKNGNQNITITKPADESFIGKAVTVRKTNGALGTVVNLVAGSGVTLSPADATPLRRIGSTATLIYVGNGAWDIAGELP